MLQADPVAEAVRVSDAASTAGITLRITGGVGIALRCPSAASTSLGRTYADIDAVGRSRERKQIPGLLAELGYEPDPAFNALHGETRLFFWDSQHGRQLDIFLDRVEMCHKIDLAKRLDVHERTLSLADLLLMKLQVVETNQKDLVDLILLLIDHPFTGDESGINLHYLGDLMASDWGLWRTTTMIAERVAQYAHELDDLDQRTRIHDQVATYIQALDAVPKTRSWRMRARVGDRVRWYELPEESH